MENINQKEKIVVRVGSIAVGVVFLVTPIFIFMTRDNIVVELQYLTLTQKISVIAIVVSYFPVTVFFLHSGISGRIPKVLDKYRYVDRK